jgi:predicted DNA-binding protein with PD1-like motif
VIVAECTRTRRLVGRLDRGSDLVSQLAEACRTHRVRAGEARAAGALEEAVVAEWDQQARSLRAPRRFAGAFEILSLAATIGERDGQPSLQAWATLSRDRDNGIELVGGRLVAARVFACEFVIDAFDDVALPRTLDAATGLMLWQPSATQVVEAADAGTSQPSPPSFEAPPRTTWSDVVAASERRVEPLRGEAMGVEVLQETVETEALGQPEVLVKPGDYIDHPKFGRVLVERIEGDYEFVSARLRNQRLIRLSLDVLTLIPAGQAEGRNLFRAVAGK